MALMDPRFAGVSNPLLLEMPESLCSDPIVDDITRSAAFAFFDGLKKGVRSLESTGVLACSCDAKAPFNNLLTIGVFSHFVSFAFLHIVACHRDGISPEELVIVQDLPDEFRTIRSVSCQYTREPSLPDFLIGDPKEVRRHFDGLIKKADQAKARALGKD